MAQKAILKLIDDVSVVVPDSLNTLTTYVLREQGDWFEDEIRFVRQLLKPRQKAIDIGANYGVFTLSMAKAVGPQGSIWAFEPATSVAAYLANSLAINGFDHVTLDPRALSAKAGTARLLLQDICEGNHLVREGAVADVTETVTLISLDDGMREYGWSGIDFVKIDAEGEEAAIIHGGGRFFQTQSPLVQYEVRADGVLNLELVHAFADIGYTSYRLIPGLGALAPFDPDEAVDSYLLNLFCCKPDRAAMVAAGGHLVTAENAQAASTIMRTHDILRDGNAVPKYGWQNTLTQRPYGQRLAESWRLTVSRGESRGVEKALALHALAHDSEAPLPERVVALQNSLEILTAVCNVKPGFLRYGSLARVARESGARSTAVSALYALLQQFLKNQHVNPTEPFLAASERFARLAPHENINDWIVCSILEEFERNHMFSSFYSPPSVRQHLQFIVNSGLGSPDMASRLGLIEQRYFPASKP